MNSAGVRGVCIRSPGQGRATATPFVRLPGQKRRVDEFAEDRDIHNNAFPLQEFASAATTLGFLGDTPTEVFASAGLLLTAAGILVAEVLQSSADTRVNKDAAPTSDPPQARAVPESPEPSSASITVTECDNVSQARDWIMAWRERQAAFVQPVVESVALTDSAISESLQESASNQESDAEARRQEVNGWISEFRLRTEASAAATVPPAAVPEASKAVEAQSTSTSDVVKSPNPFAAFFSWLRSLWTAIINLFKQDSGSKPQTA